MKIAFDIDDVLAEFHAGFRPFYNQKYGTNYSAEDYTDFNFWNFMPVSKEEIFKRMYEFFATPEFADLKPLNHAIELINQLKSQYELYCLTSRDNQFVPLTEAWIKRYFGDAFKAIYFTNQQSQTGDKVTKADICLAKGIDFLIEDAPHHALETATRGIKTIILETPWNRNFTQQNENLFRIKDLLEIPAILSVHQ